MERRWDTDERGRGVASAAHAVPDLDRLRAAMLEPDWVAEEPERHLLPHVERACLHRGWRLSHADVVDGVLELEVVAVEDSFRGLREVAFALVSTFSEASTHLVEARPDEHAVELLVTTGMLEGDGAFAAHGHVVRLAVRSG